MSHYYTLTTPGTSPVSLTEMKACMKVTSSSDDAWIQTLIDNATEYGEDYTGREFRANTWTLLIDALTGRNCINRNPVASITSIKHLVSDVLTLIPSTDYYKKDLTQWSEILLEANKAWPTNTDDKEHAIEIIFVTAAHRRVNTAIVAIKRHVTYLYQNRGDCGQMDSSVKLSGAADLYNTIRIPRI